MCFRLQQALVACQSFGLKQHSCQDTKPEQVLSLFSHVSTDFTVLYNSLLSSTYICLERTVLVQVVDAKQTPSRFRQAILVLRSPFTVDLCKFVSQSASSIDQR